MAGTVAANLAAVEARIREAEKRAGRKSCAVQLVLVSKTVAPEKVAEAAAAGIQDFGENRVQELLEKKQALANNGLRWHMIGRLQSNKVKQVLPHAFLIHSLDRLELAEEISRQAAALNIARVPCLIQINSSGETTKAGIKPEEAADFAAMLEKYPALAVEGLMTIGPLTEDAGLIRQAFKRTREIRDDLRRRFPGPKWDTLSMGMSGDFEIAIAEGATMVRIGSAVFGPRQ